MEKSTENTNIYCVRANFGNYTEHFINGGYIAIGWMNNSDLSNIKSRDELKENIIQIKTALKFGKKKKKN